MKTLPIRSMALCSLALVALSGNSSLAKGRGEILEREARVKRSARDYFPKDENGWCLLWKAIFHERLDHALVKNKDSDGDGITDFDEMLAFSDPLSAPFYPSAKSVREQKEREKKRARDLEIQTEHYRKAARPFSAFGHSQAARIRKNVDQKIRNVVDLELTPFQRTQWKKKVRQNQDQIQSLLKQAEKVIGAKTTSPTMAAGIDRHGNIQYGTGASNNLAATIGVLPLTFHFSDWEARNPNANPDSYVAPWSKDYSFPVEKINKQAPPMAMWDTGWFYEEHEQFNEASCTLTCGEPTELCINAYENDSALGGAGIASFRSNKSHPTAVACAAVGDATNADDMRTTFTPGSGGELSKDGVGGSYPGGQMIGYSLTGYIGEMDALFGADLNKLPNAVLEHYLGNSFFNYSIDLLDGTTGAITLPTSGERLLIFWRTPSIPLRVTIFNSAGRHLLLDFNNAFTNGWDDLINELDPLWGTTPTQAQETILKDLVLTVRGFSTNLTTEEKRQLILDNGPKVVNHSWIAHSGWGYYQRASDGLVYPGWDGNKELSTVESHSFGLYGVDAHMIDSVAYQHPYVLQCWSAGNEGGLFHGSLPTPGTNDPQPPPGQHLERDSNGFFDFVVTSNNFRPFDSEANDVKGYDTLSPQAVAKNLLVLSASIHSANGPSSSVKWAPISSSGPPDSGAIKPDLAGGGGSDSRLAKANIDGYSNQSGTSIASPSVAGAIALMDEYVRDLSSNYSYAIPKMPYLSSTRKGIFIHTAIDLIGNSGTNETLLVRAEGPDYKTGWGLTNAFAAMELVSDNFASDISDDSPAGIEDLRPLGHLAHIKESRIFDTPPGEVADKIEFQVKAKTTGSDPLKITICWTDPAGSIRAETLDDYPTAPDYSSRNLVNDLDLQLYELIFDSTTNTTEEVRVTKNGNILYPWTLDPSAPKQPARTDRPNRVDNVEQIVLNNPNPGAIYVARIISNNRITGNGGNGVLPHQDVSIIISGNEPVSRPRFQISDITKLAGDNYAITWPTVVGGRYRIETSSDLATWDVLSIPGHPAGFVASTEITTMEVSPPQAAESLFYRIVWF